MRFLEQYILSNRSKLLQGIIVRVEKLQNDHMSLLWARNVILALLDLEILSMVARDENCLVQGLTRREISRYDVSGIVRSPESLWSDTRRREIVRWNRENDVSNIARSQRCVDAVRTYATRALGFSWEQRRTVIIRGTFGSFGCGNPEMMIRWPSMLERQSVATALNLAALNGGNGVNTYLVAGCGRYWASKKLWTVREGALPHVFDVEGSLKAIVETEMSIAIFGNAGPVERYWDVGSLATPGNTKERIESFLGSQALFSSSLTKGD